MSAATEVNCNCTAFGDPAFDAKYCAVHAARHPDLDVFDQALADHERTADERDPNPLERAHAAIAALAAAFGFRFGVLTDGTILLEPAADPNCCGICATQAR